MNTHAPSFDELLDAARSGGPAEFGILLEHSYSRLRAIAENVADEGACPTMGPSALLHEGFLKIQKGLDLATIRDAKHFYRVFAKCMKQSLIDYIRGHDTDKRGGKRVRVDLEALLVKLHLDGRQLPEVIEAFEELEAQFPRAAMILECQVFGCLTIAEISQLHGVSRSTVEQDLRFAKAYLRMKLTD